MADQRWADSFSREALGESGTVRIPITLLGNEKHSCRNLNGCVEKLSQHRLGFTLPLPVSTTEFS